MDKFQLRATARNFLRESHAAFPPVFETAFRSRRHRVPPPLDKERARQACAPMGVLQSVVVTVDARKRRRIWYIVDPDPAVEPQYRKLGLDLTPGCKVLVDAEMMRPIAVLDFDPAGAGDSTPSAHGFNPYFDLPPT